MRNYLDTTKVRYIKRLILSKDYNLSRADRMNDLVHHWKESCNHTNTVTGRTYCNMMVNMYMKRYQYYINK